MAFYSRAFTKQIQISKATALHNECDVNNLSNYWPINILPEFSKGLETKFHSRLTHFHDKYNIFSSSRYDFRKNMSTEMALLKQKEIFVDAFEHKKLALGIFIDVSKAFHLIKHVLLGNKLHNHGVRGKASSLIQ